LAGVHVDEELVKLEIDAGDPLLVGDGMVELGQQGVALAEDEHHALDAVAVAAMQGGVVVEQCDQRGEGDQGAEEAHNHDQAGDLVGGHGRLLVEWLRFVISIKILKNTKKKVVLLTGVLKNIFLKILKKLFFSRIL
jgi:hypothetical protein